MADHAANTPTLSLADHLRGKRAALFLALIYLALMAIYGLAGAVLAAAVGVIVLVILGGLVLLSIRESTIAVIGFLLVFFWLFLASAAPLLGLNDPNAIAPEAVRVLNDINTANLLADAAEDSGVAFPGTPDQLALLETATWFDFGFGEGQSYWLGSDIKGRDMLSRIIWGSQRVLLWATLATLVAYVVGMTFGVMAGYLGGWWDEAISFVANIMLAFPVMVLYIVIINALGASGVNVIIAVTFASAPGIMRIVRGLVLDLRSRDYIAAAQTRGESAVYIMAVELLPNARGPLIVDGCLRLGYTIIAIATLGFLGLGLPPPDPDWGSMLNEARPRAPIFPHMILLPAIALSSLILGFNLLADGLREISLRD